MGANETMEQLPALPSSIVQNALYHEGSSIQGRNLSLGSTIQAAADNDTANDRAEKQGTC